MLFGSDVSVHSSPEMIEHWVVLTSLEQSKLGDLFCSLAGAWDGLIPRPLDRFALEEIENSLHGADCSLSKAMC